MSTIFHFNDDKDNYEDIDINELYEQHKKNELRKLEIYNKILCKIHNKIKVTSRINKLEQWCWYQVPSVLIGVPEYNFNTCINYLIDKLSNNGFSINYYKPNLLLISWKHWIPEYVRDEVFKKLGKKIDNFGNVIPNDEEDNKEKNNEENSNKKHVTFKSTTDYEELNNKNVYNIKVIEKLNKINK